MISNPKRDMPKLNTLLLKSKILKAMPELNTSSKSNIGIRGIACPKTRFSTAKDFDTKSITIKKNITR